MTMNQIIVNFKLDQWNDNLITHEKQINRTQYKKSNEMCTKDLIERMSQVTSALSPPV